MPDLAHPLRFPTQRYPGYHGEEPFTIPQQQRDAPLRHRVPVFPPTPVMKAAVGVVHRDTVRIKAYSTIDDPVTHLPDYRLYSHPVIMLTPSSYPLRAALQGSVLSQLQRTYPDAPITSYSAPSINEITAFLGGLQRG